MPGEVVGGSGEGFRYRYMVRLRSVLVQVPGEVPEGSCADRYLVRFPAQVPDEVPEFSVRDSW